MAQHQRKHQRRRGHQHLSWLYGVISLLIILGTVAAGCIVFFRVDRVEVEGARRYTQEEIIGTSGIEYGSNLILFRKDEVVQKLLKDLVYVDQVSVYRDLPSTIRIRVDECEIAGAVKD